MIKNKLYLALIIIIIFVFLSSLITVGCRTGDQKQITEKEAQTEESAGEEKASVPAEEKEEEEVPQIIDISPEEVYEIISKGEEFLILDVRTPDEFNEGHIEGAVLIPVDELERRLDELPKDKPIITYCRSGVRSRNAANILLENGFSKVYDMMGGIIEWINKGYPAVDG